MARSKILVGFLCGVTLGACAIRPLPEDVTGVDTATIVKKTRCEARDAVVQGRINYVSRKYPQVVDEDSLITLTPTFDRRTKYFLDYFGTTGIVYSFTLDGSESSGASFVADVVRPLTNSTTTITPSLGNSLLRENIRTFTISDNFNELLSRKTREFCGDMELPGRNYEYPIVGRIGVDEMVKTFVKLTLKEGLSEVQDLSKGPTLGGAPSNATPIAMVDTITFTTTISAGLTPKAVFSPPGTDWRLADATLTLGGSRIDKHQVIIGLALAAPPSPPVLVGERIVSAPAAARFDMLLNASRTPRLITTRPPLPHTGEAAALDAVNNQILRFEVPKSLIVAP